MDSQSISQDNGIELSVFPDESLLTLPPYSPKPKISKVKPFRIIDSYENRKHANHTPKPKHHDIEIFTMSWNTESIRFCAPGEETVELPFFRNQHCKPTDFFRYLVENVIKVSHRQYDLLIFSLQEDAFPGSFLLPEVANDLLAPEYKLLTFSDWIGVGVTSWKAFKQGELLMRGLRTAIYVKNNATFDNMTSETVIEECSFKDKFTSGKGAIMTRLLHPETFQSLVIVNMHLPFAADSLKGDSGMREKALDAQNNCFKSIYHRIQKKWAPQHLIMMGDLNYRISRFVFGDVDMVENLIRQQDWQTLYQEGDELLAQIRQEKIPLMSEGTNNTGPMFAPTCKMIIGRPDIYCNTSEQIAKTPEICYNVGREQQRMPSWCDRILFNTFKNNGQTPNQVDMTCRFYDRWEWGQVMTSSDHASVIAGFTIPAPYI